MHLYLITYDIPSDRPRTRLADLLEDYGQRVQYSVFEAWLTEKQVFELMGRIRTLLEGAPEGGVRFYRLCADCRRQVVVIGQGETPTPPGPVII